jgi:Ala-tRNA(Pro) deacylase
MKKVVDFLEQNDIEYKMHMHDPVFTVEEAKATRASIPGLHCKNLFLRNQKGNRHFLVIFPADKPVDLKLLAPKLGINRISFASADRLKRIMGLNPGSVSIFGLLNDDNQEVELYLDQGVLEADFVTFHPNDNTATVSLAQDQFMYVLEKLSRDFKKLK